LDKIRDVELSPVTRLLRNHRIEALQWNSRFFHEVKGEYFGLFMRVKMLQIQSFAVGLVCEEDVVFA
jgi:hypothetical protein